MRETSVQIPRTLSMRYGIVQNRVHVGGKLFSTPKFKLSRPNKLSKQFYDTRHSNAWYLIKHSFSPYRVAS